MPQRFFNAVLYPRQIALGGEGAQFSHRIGDLGSHAGGDHYFWALARDDRSWLGDAPPGVAFTYAPGRGSKYADDILKDFSGILQVDGYAGYNRLLKRASQDVELAYCWAHARRKLYDVAKASAAPIAQERGGPTLSTS